jgi:hypothetical protein
MLLDLPQKLHQSGATSTVVAPRWQGKAWHHALTELACHEMVLPARAHLFRPGRRHGCGTIGKPHRPVTVFWIPSRYDCISAGAQSMLPLRCLTHDKSNPQSRLISPEQQKYDTISRCPAATTLGPPRCAPTCNAYWAHIALEQKLSSY